jgi:ABC-type phosphate transport system substrate-binding protein
MTSFSARRLAACVVSVAAVASVAIPATASAAKKPVTDLGTQCSGVNIAGRGSTFQNPAQLVWNPGFNKNTSTVGCSGTQGSKGTPKAEYKQGGANSGSGSCIRAFGAEKEAPLWSEFSYCGTDEAPNATQKAEMESHKVGGEEKSIESIPVAQGALAVIVHLPAGCLASSEVEQKGKTSKLGRFAFDHTTVEGIYRGTITTWKQAIEAQKGDGKDVITCKVASEAEDTITPVVRLDSSGTTHIFKTYLSLVNGAKFTAEAFAEEIGGKKTGCGSALPAEEKAWAEVAQGCQNQRWPAAAHVLRASEAGNPGVVKGVASTPSSIGYADLAVAREYGFFSKKGEGGENKKGSATKQGEQNTRFWIELQNSAPSTTVTFSDPSSKGDVENVASSNCKKTVYTNEAGKAFPPANTRELWNAAKAELTEADYSICGLTYDLAVREYKPYLTGIGTEAEQKSRATTVANYLAYEVSSKGGGKELKNHDYEGLPAQVRKEAEAGIAEIGYAVP